MQCLLIFILLFLIISSELGTGDPGLFQSIRDDLKDLDMSCDDSDSCNEDRYSDSLKQYACHCGASCAELGTCCLDSNFINAPQLKLNLTCGSVHNSDAHFMVDHCPANDSAWESLCNAEWDGEDDIMRFLPVISLSTTITYKNYFCFRCHEDTDNFFYWNVMLKGEVLPYGTTADDSDLSKHGNKSIIPVYNRSNKTWVIPTEKGGIHIPVLLTPIIPNGKWNLSKICVPDVISNCSDTWSDLSVSEKCSAYMAIKEVQRNSETLKYRNVHCALCNFEDVANAYCTPRHRFHFDPPRFSYVHLLDVNPSSGDEVGKIRNCTDDDHIWDPIKKECRKVKCLRPGYKPKKGECVPE